jgi:hypothetical protein
MPSARVVMPNRFPIWIAAAGVLAAADAWGQSASTRGQAPLVTDAVAGAAFLGHSESHAVGHAFKPSARLGLRATLAPRWELGGALSGIVDASEHYRVVGVLVQGRGAIVNGPVFSLGASLALGLGPDADVLHDGLRGTDGLRGYGFAALDARWTIASRWLLGAEAAWENLSIGRFGLVVGTLLGERQP